MVKDDIKSIKTSKGKEKKEEQNIQMEVEIKQKKGK